MESTATLYETEAIDRIWSYRMRREMQEIVPGLYLGPYSVAMKSKAEQLEKTGITHIICVRQAIESNFIRPNFPDKFQYLVIDVADYAPSNIIKYLPKMKYFIDQSLLHGGKVLVHGNAGILRSAALVTGYVMETYSLSFKEAYRMVQMKRFCINLTDSFKQQLEEYEPIYRAYKIQQNGQTSKATGMLKRRFDELEDNESGMCGMEC